MTVKYRNLSVALVAVFLFVFLASGVSLAGKHCDLADGSAKCKVACKDSADCQKKCKEMCKDLCKDHKPGECTADCKSKCEKKCEKSGAHAKASGEQAGCAKMANATQTDAKGCCASSKTAEVKQASASKTEMNCGKSCGSTAMKACSTTKSCSMASKDKSQ